MPREALLARTLVESDRLDPEQTMRGGLITDSTSPRTNRAAGAPLAAPSGTGTGIRTADTSTRAILRRRVSPASAFAMRATADKEAGHYRG